MKYRITVIAGAGLYANGSPIPGFEKTLAVKRIHEYASERFGGLTLRVHMGSWKANGKVITEPGVTCEVLVDDYLKDNPDVSDTIRLRAVTEHANAFAVFVRSALQQTSVVLTIDKPAFAAFVE